MRVYYPTLMRVYDPTLMPVYDAAGDVIETHEQPIAGVSVDKLLALRGDPNLRIAFDQPHQHNPRSYH